MKKWWSLVYLLMAFNVFAFEIDDTSKTIWKDFEEVYNSYIDKIKNANSNDEIDAIDELYNRKIDAIIQDDIMLKVTQSRFLFDNIIEIISVRISALSFSNGSYICSLKIYIKAKVDIHQPEFSFTGSTMMFNYNNKDYELDTIVIYNKDKEVIYTSNMVLAPKLISAGQTGLIKLGMMNLDRRDLINGEIIIFM